MKSHSKSSLVILILALFLAHTLAASPSLSSRFKPASVSSSSDDFTADDLRAVFYNAFDGMYLYSYISGSKLCITNLDYLISDMINGTINYYNWFNDLQQRIPFEYGTFNYTNSMGRWSPILRNCYKIGGQVDSNWQNYWSSWNNITVFYTMVKANIVRNYTDIDDRSSSLYDAINALDLPQMSFDFWRLVYLFFFQALTQKVTLLSQAFVPMVQTLYPADAYTYDYAHLTAEYMYEMLRGARLIDEDQLDMCESNITDFSREYHLAVDYYNLGKQRNDFPMMREGVFRVADAFMRMTNTTWQCYTVFRLT